MSKSRLKNHSQMKNTKKTRWQHVVLNWMCLLLRALSRPYIMVILENIFICRIHTVKNSRGVSQQQCTLKWFRKKMCCCVIYLWFFCKWEIVPNYILKNNTWLSTHSNCLFILPCVSYPQTFQFWILLYILPLPWNNRLL